MYYKKLRLTVNYYESEDEEASRLSRLVLPKWIKVSEKRFNEMLNAITEAENNGLKTDVDGEEITLDKVESLLKGLGTGKIDKHEFKEKYNGIACDAKTILKRQPFTTNEKNMIEIISLLREIYKPKDKKQMNNQILQICLNYKAKNLLNKKKFKKKKA